jgi:hypothetical protein
VGYRESQNPDGTFNLHDVEIMGTVPPGKKGAKDGVDRDWLQSCVDAMQRDAARGYLPPVHLYHHGDPNNRPVLVCQMRALRVGEFHGDPTIYVDLVNIPASFRDELAALRWPYRSVEVGSYEAPMVASLALLSDQPPHFPYPMLVPQNGASEHLAPEFAALTESADVCRMYAYAGNGLVACFKYGEDEADEDEDKDAEKPSAKDEEKPEGSAADAPPSKDTDEPEAPAAEAAPAAPAAAAVAGHGVGSTDVAAMLNRVLDLIDPDRIRAAPTAAAAVMQQDGATRQPTDPAAGGAPGSGPVGTMAADPAVAAMSGEVAALRSVIRDRDDAGRVEALVAGAVVALANYSLSDPTKESIREIARTAGKVGVDGFVAAFRAQMPPDPAPTMDAAFARSAGSTPDDDPAIQHYAARGPEAITAFRTAQADYRRVCAEHRGFSLPLTSFLRSHPLTAQFAAQETSR